MAQMFEVELSRPNSSVPWGFRLQGGADFSTPLSIQLVQPESVAADFGLQAGDGILQINGTATETLDHEAAKMEIIRSGNDVKFLIQRGAVTTWRPKVTPMSELRPAELQTHTLPGEAPPIQKTSLAANKQPALHIGSSHNRAPKPFGSAGGTSISPERHVSVKDSFPNRNVEHYSQSQAQEEYTGECGGYVPDVDYNINQSQRMNPNAPQQQQPGVMHSQYNSPGGLYSQQNADVMRDQFGSMSLKHENKVPTGYKPVSSNLNNNNVVNKAQPATIAAPTAAHNPEMRKSPVMMAIEAEQDPEPSLYRGGKIQSKTFKMLEQELQEGAGRDSVLSAPAANNTGLPAGMRSVQAPKAGQKMGGPKWKQPTSSCYVCGQPITGIFVRVKEHCLHSDCLRCAQCKRSLKNIGYIWVKDQLYCVQHARELTRPPGGGYTAYVIDAPEGV